MIARSALAAEPKLSTDFHRLWAAFTVSQLGSALSTGALPLIAIIVVGASDFRVALLAALSAVVGAVVALPLGPFVEFRRKRPVMISADLLCFVTLATVPVAMAFGILGYAQLCAVATAQVLGTMVFNAASGAHLKALVPDSMLATANSRFETTFWTVSGVGAPIGGMLIGVFGAGVTVLIDAVSFLLSALGVRSLAQPEPPPPVAEIERHWTADIRGGWTHIFRHRTLHALFWNAMVFGGAVRLTGPLLAVLMLRDLGLSPWQYGIALGIPSFGGIVGSLLTGRLIARFGERDVLLGFGVLRTCWMGLLVLAGPGVSGLVVVVIAETALLFCAGVFNPVFTAFRMRATDDEFMARVGIAWSITSRCCQPVFIALGGALAAATSVRFAIGCAAVAVLASSLLLPWRSRAGLDQIGLTT
ncbi:MFS transporter [Nocardia tenerifensis]|uniref:MFS transporter n=1 Tax=Nocardia tenerifensis TaxID=228006 RepID=A0A318K4C2_9NOCA|nr:MFS transporter [Nocardia tenerifensis]PXX63053.1 MFS transporter [Nocardia tenerifensis]